MTIANPDEVRRLSGNRSVQLVSDAKIAEVIMFSDTYCRTFTQNYDWAIGDPDYASIKAASELLASSQIRSGFKDEDDESEEQWDRGISILTAVNEHVASAGVGGRVTMRTRPYRTNPMNPNVPYRRAIAYPYGNEDGIPFV